MQCQGMTLANICFLIALKMFPFVKSMSFRRLFLFFFSTSIYVPIISFVWRVFNGVLNVMRGRKSRAEKCAHSNSIHWQWTCVELNENVAIVSMNWRYATLTLMHIWSEVCINAKFNGISDYIHWNNWFWHSQAKKPIINSNKCSGKKKKWASCLDFTSVESLS